MAFVAVKWRLAALALVVVVAALAVAFRGPILRTTLAGVLGVATGTRVSFGSVQLGTRSARFDDVAIERRGQPLLSAARIDVNFSLRDLLPGGRHRYGIRSLDVIRPTLTIVRLADRTYNVSGLAGKHAAGPPPPVAAPQTPLALRARIEDGTVLLRDLKPFDPKAAELRVTRLNASADVNTNATTRYQAGAAYLSEGQEFPLNARGLIDAVRGASLSRFHATVLPLGGIVNFLIASKAAHLEAGRVRDADVLLYDGAHLAARARLDEVRFALIGFHAPLDHLNGPLEAFDAGTVTSGMSATVAGVPLNIRGGMVDFAQPQLRLRADIAGPLEKLRTAFLFSARQPLAGDIAINALVEGAIGNPLILAHVEVPHLRYHDVPVERIHGTVAYFNGAASLVPIEARYGGVDVRTDGAFAIGTHLVTQIAAAANAPATAIPYAAQLIPGAHVRVVGLLDGYDNHFATRGLLDANGGGATAIAPFQIDPEGAGSFGPIALDRADGASLLGAFYLDRPRSESAFWADVHGLRFEPLAAGPEFPGLPSLRAPVFDGRVDAKLAGVGPPSSFRIAGDGAVHDLHVGTFTVAKAEGRVGGRMNDLRLDGVRASGRWGSFTGSGAYDGVRLALNGDYAGSYGALQTFTGNIGATGGLQAPVALLVDPGGIVVQTASARSADGLVRGVPLNAFGATLTVHGAAIRLAAGEASVAGGSLAAAGGLSTGGRVGLSLSDLRADRLGRTGIPITAGTLAAIGTARLGVPGGLVFDGGALVDDGRSLGFPIAANADLGFAGTGLRLGQVLARFAQTPLQADGRLTGIGAHAPAYDLNLRVRGAQLATVIAAAAVTVPVPVDGSADADLHLGGSGKLPRVTGPVRVPEATVNGLAIRNANGLLRATPGRLAVDGGRLQVGSTTAAASASEGSGESALDVRSDRADLSDFDDFFDPGDMLAGRGELALSFARSRGEAVRSSGRVGLAGLRYDHFRLGDGGATWRSVAGLLSGQTNFRGALGTLQANGSVVLPNQGRLRRLLADAGYDARVQAAGLDIGAWALALGYSAPIAGTIDADGTIRGRFPRLAISGSASLANGRYGKLPIDRLAITAASTLDRAKITDAELEVGSIDARGSGSFGFENNAPIDLAVHASGADIGTVVAKLTGNTLPVTGAFESDVRVSGPLRKPRITGGFDVERGAFAGVILPRTLGSFETNGRNVVLRDAEIAFQRGSLELAGSIPFTLSPLGLGPLSAPVTLEIGANAIALDNFAPLLPHGSSVAGIINGRVALGGTAGDPNLIGQLALDGGQLTTPLEIEPLRNGAASLLFSATQVRLERLTASLGPGSIEATGSASFPDLVHLGADSTFDVTASVRNALLDFPAYGRGQFEGTLHLAHTPQHMARLSGGLTLQDATVPFAALIAPAAGGGNSSFIFPSTPTTPFGLPNVAFKLNLAVGKNVRVRSSVIDLGAEGNLAVGGSLASPTLSGGFDSTGGTLTYFNTVFRLLQGTVTFQPDAGLVPVLSAQATTHVINPDPNPQRNATGSADITLAVSGPVTNLSIALTSDPSYDRQQILGLLLSAPAIGATSLFSNQPGLLGPGQAPQPGLPPGVVIPNATGISVAQEAFGIVNAQFTRNLLAPLESAFGGALGLSSVNVTFDYTGAVGLTARKVLGKEINAVFGQSFGYPYRQTFGIEVRPSAATALQLTLFQTYGQQDVLFPIVYGTQTRTFAAQPAEGQNGFSFSFQRFFR